MSRGGEALRSLAALALLAALPSGLAAQSEARFEVEVEAGGVWQSRNTVQIPNDASATRFSLANLVGSGPRPTGRLYLTWHLAERHALRALLAPLTVTDTGVPGDPVSFAGESFAAGTTVEGRYRFNSWRLGYRYRALSTPSLDLWVGFTAKLRDAEVRLSQGGTRARDTDVGFVPLLHLAGEWRPAERLRAVLDFDGLAGGPGRAFDVALKLGYDLDERWTLGLGYRTLEGGADVDSVYNFAWFQYGTVSLAYRF